VRTLVVAGVIFGLLLWEALLSARHERSLRILGAVEPPGDVFPAMRIAYPLLFLAMTIEGLLRGSAGAEWLAAGTVVFLLAKLLKYVAIATLGVRWSFRVLVLPGAPLVTRGIYRYVRHPNYLALIGELVGAALLLHAPTAGIAGTLGFGVLLRKRIRVEEQALGERASTT
jgi:methyltransferase